MTRLALLLLVLGVGGCAYTVRLLSDPVGATVLLPDGREVVTPAEATFRSGTRQLVRVEAVGHRALVVDMQKTEGNVLRQIGGALFTRGGREVTFVLVPEHPPVGSEP